MREFEIIKIAEYKEEIYKEALDAKKIKQGFGALGDKVKLMNEKTKAFAKKVWESTPVQNAAGGVKSGAMMGAAKGGIGGGLKGGVAGLKGALGVAPKKRPMSDATKAIIGAGIVGTGALGYANKSNKRKNRTERIKARLDYLTEKEKAEARAKLRAGK